MKHVDIYTDGSCRGNPGVGGWGAILVYGKHQKVVRLEFGLNPGTTDLVLREY